MNHLFVDLCHSLERDSVPLLDGERVICRFELHEGAYPVIAEVKHRLQVQRVGINPNVRAEPSEEPTVICPLPLTIEFLEMLEVLLAERGPYSPREGFVVTDHGKLQAPSYKEELLIDHAGVGRQ